MIAMIAFFVVITGLVIIKDWLFYKHRGRVQPDDPSDENPPVITGPSDALSQRLVDLCSKEKSKGPEK